MNKVFSAASNGSKRIRVDAERDTQVLNSLMNLCKVIVRLFLTIKKK